MSSPFDDPIESRRNHRLALAIFIVVFAFFAAVVIARVMARESTEAAQQKTDTDSIIELLEQN